MRIHVVLHATGANRQRKLAQGSRFNVAEGKGEFDLGRTGDVNILFFFRHPSSSHKNALGAGGDEEDDEALGDGGDEHDEALGAGGEEHDEALGAGVDGRRRA